MDLGTDPMDHARNDFRGNGSGELIKFKSNVKCVLLRSLGNELFVLVLEDLFTVLNSVCFVFGELLQLPLLIVIEELYVVYWDFVN